LDEVHPIRRGLPDLISSILRGVKEANGLAGLETQLAGQI
jgi:hypothetical protein